MLPNKEGVFCTVLLLVAYSHCYYYNTDIARCGKVHLTVSSLGTYLEMNWVTRCNHPDDMKPDAIGLYDKNPLDRNEALTPKALVLAKKYPDGYYRTRIKFGDPWLPGSWEFNENTLKADPGQHCFPYWIASYKGNDAIDVQCLKISPTWMTDNSKHIGMQRIGSMMIPGTHNSGSSHAATILQNYVMNQDRSVWTQLVYGIRYLDFRVGYYEDEGFFINHDLVRISPLLPILREIRRFAELAPKEIVVVDFHRFPYPSRFSAKIHQKLIAMLNLELGDLAVFSTGAQMGRGPTLNEIWAQNRSLIICYGNKDMVKGKDWLWNPIQQLWGNTHNPQELKIFLDSAIRDHKTVLNPMWALMAELTPQTLDVVFRTNSLRKLADIINRDITKWFRQDWSFEVNIVATDFFLGNDIINIAIAKNIRG